MIQPASGFDEGLNLYDRIFKNSEPFSMNFRKLPMTYTARVNFLVFSAARGYFHRLIYFGKKKWREDETTHIELGT